MSCFSITRMMLLQSGRVASLQMIRAQGIMVATVSTGPAVTYIGREVELNQMLILGTPVDAPKKRKRNLHGIRPKGKSKASSSNDGPSSSRPPPPSGDDPLVGLTVSNLLSRYGVLRDEFNQMFRVCNYCKRIVSLGTRTPVLSQYMLIIC